MLIIKVQGELSVFSGHTDTDWELNAAKGL